MAKARLIKGRIVGGDSDRRTITVKVPGDEFPLDVNVDVLLLQVRIQDLLTSRELWEATVESSFGDEV